MIWQCPQVRGLKVLSDLKSLEVLWLPSNFVELPLEEIVAIESLRNHPSLKQIGAQDIPNMLVENRLRRTRSGRHGTATTPGRCASVKPDSHSTGGDSTMGLGASPSPATSLSLICPFLLESGSACSTLSAPGCRT